MTETTMDLSAVAKIDANDVATPMWRIFVGRFFENRAAVVSLGVIVGLCLMAAFADYIAAAMGIDANSGDLLTRYGAWSNEHWFGTDEAGRDVFLRLIYGARVSMAVAVLTAVSSAMIGVFLGAIAGYFGGFLDTAIMRVVDSLLSIPTVPILILLAAVDLGKLPVLSFLLSGEDSSIIKMIIILVVFSWMTQARLVRGAIISAKEHEYVLAARLVGYPNRAIIFREILPNIMSAVIVSVTLNVGGNILFESALSFLGLGIQPPTPTWGNMLTNAQELIYEAPELAVIPGLMILVTVMAFNFVGDGLQDALDPKAIRR